MGSLFIYFNLIVICDLITTALRVMPYRECESDIPKILKYVFRVNREETLVVRARLFIAVSYQRERQGVVEAVIQGSLIVERWACCV